MNCNDWFVEEVGKGEGGQNLPYLTTLGLRVHITLYDKKKDKYKLNKTKYSLDGYICYQITS